MIVSGLTIYCDSAYPDLTVLFTSYTHEGKLFAQRLLDALQGRGVRRWLDEKQMLPGDDIGIRLLCRSQHSLTS